ncbi:flagellar biosynthesis protein FliR [Arcobacter sp. 31_11_sub10_T18]|nr:flagellar biosynthesis protein FliR [Arcobacter sp. 31_11_sub10_T18]
MQALISLLNADVVFPFLLLLARIISFVAFMPVFSHKAVPAKIRIAFAFFLTVFLFPLIDVQNTITQDMFVEGLIREITLGLVASFFVSIVFSAVTIIGDLVGYSTALSMASQFDPASGTQQGVIGRLLYMIVLVLFFQTGMYEVTLVILAQSFDLIHLGQFDIFSYDGISIAIIEVKRMFAFAFSFAFPLFFIGFLIDIYFGYGTKSMPAFSPFVVTFQLKFALVFLFMMFGMQIFAENFKEYFLSKFS